MWKGGTFESQIILCRGNSAPECFSKLPEFCQNFAQIIIFWFIGGGGGAEVGLCNVVSSVYPVIIHCMLMICMCYVQAVFLGIN